MDLVIIRCVFIAIVAITCYHLQPFGLVNFPRYVAACAGAAIGVGVVWFEWRLRVVTLKRLIGAVIGSILGILGAYTVSKIFGKPHRPQVESISEVRSAQAPAPRN